MKKKERDKMINKSYIPPVYIQIKDILIDRINAVIKLIRCSTQIVNKIHVTIRNEVRIFVPVIFFMLSPLLFC